jgi:Phage replication protein CRI
VIDTIKLGIPLTRSQLTKLHIFLADDERWQWVQMQSSTGEIRLLRCRGLAHLDQQSFRREIFWDIPQNYEPDRTFLVLELSLPKFWYGHNIHLLYGFVDALQVLRTLLQTQLHCRFPDVTSWQVWRVDCCYSWRTPSNQTAQQMLDSLKRLNFPYKKPVIYPTTILFTGSTYSVKFYLKYPEFINNDRKELLKSNASLEWINHLEGLARGVLRVEATLRRKYLKRKKIETVGDLTKSLTKIEWSEEFFELNDYTPDDEFGLNLCAAYILSHDLVAKSFTDEQIYERLIRGEKRQFIDGEVCCAEPGTMMLDEIPIVYKGGYFTVRLINNPTSILQYFLNKFLGSNRVMQEADEVKAKLLEVYKSNKAAKLISMWLYVQKFGRANAKEIFGKHTFYRAQQDLKNAGCSFIEPPVTTTLNDEFIKSFGFDVPSSHCTNTVDDYRDSTNLINLLPHLARKAQSQQAEGK